jgi:hypothetical protein
MNHGDGIEFAEANTAVVGEGADGWDEALGGGAAGKGCGDDERGLMHGVGQGQTAGCTTGVDEENLHTYTALCGGLLGIGTKRSGHHKKK